MLTYFTYFKTAWLADHAVSDHNNDLLALLVRTDSLLQV